MKKFSCIIATNTGNFLEYFEFALFGYLSSIIAIQFFPSHDDLALNLTLLIYAAGFISRPIGGIIFGYIGDIYGRKLSLIATIF